MEYNVTSPTFRNNVLKFGILIALVNIILVLLVYAIDISLMVKWWFGLLLLVLNIALVLYAGFEWRKQNEGFLTFKSAFIFVFLVLAVSGLFGILFQLLLYNVIDPNLKSTMTEAALEETQAMMSKFGMPDDQIDIAMEKAESDMANQYSVTGMLKSYLWALIFYVIGALIVGAIVKKRRPEFEG